MNSRPGTEPASPASEPVVRNPYRVLGLSGDATWAEIRAAADRILEDPEPEAYTTPWDLPWLGEVPRSTAEVERALARLCDPRGRLRSRVFWFHERVAESAVHELQPSTIRNALEGWSATALEIARHDAAVVALIAAIALDPTVENSPLWQRALREWEEALDLEPYWMDVLRVEMEGGFEDPASLAEVRDLRDRASELVTEPLLVYAREAVIAEQNPRAARTLAVLREVLSKEAFTDRCGDLAEHVWGDFDADWTPRPPAAPEEEPEPPAEGMPHYQTQNPGMWDFAADPSEIEEYVRPSGEGGDAVEERPAEAGAGVADSTGAGAGRVEAEPVEAGPVEAEAVEAEPVEAQPVEADRDATDPVGIDPIEARPVEAPADRASEPAAESPAGVDRQGEPDRERPARRSPGRSRHRIHPALAAAAVAAVLLAAIFSPRFRPETEAGAAPADGILRADVERRMETIDAALADALFDRHRADEAVEAARESVDGYQTLVDDYQRRIANRLPADRSAYRRVTGLRDEARARLDAAVEEREGIDARIARLSSMSADLVEEWNAVTESRGAATERDPSP